MGRGREERDGGQAHPHGDCMLDPSPWVVRFAALVPAGGAVLDLACGDGRHARFFHARGHPVTALDRDVSGLADLADQTGKDRAGIEIVAADLEDGAPWPLGERRFAGIVVANYLYRPLFPHIIAALAEGGVLIYETFARGNETFTRPRNPAHLLADGELLAAFAGALRVVAYEHGRVETPRTKVVQRICALRAAADEILPLPPALE